MTDEEAKCTSCGAICHRWTMFEINTGRIQLQCPKCYLKGMSDSGKFTFGRVQSYKKAKEK